MQIEVYERESDAAEAAADEAAARILAAGETPVVALPGGRRARMVLTALAAHGELPWASTRWFATDERCGDPAAPDSAREVLMMTILAPNRVPVSALSVPDCAIESAEAARAWEPAVRAVTEDSGGFDVIVLVVGPDGSVAGLDRGAPADGHVAIGAGGRVSIGGAALARARAIVVVATGDGVQGALRDALTATADPATEPLRWVLPDDGRVTWFVDRAAVAGLLDDARPVES